MKVSLLIAIRQSNKRLHPAIKKQGQSNPIKEKLYQYLRVLSPLEEIPILSPRNYRFFLDGSIRSNSKTGIALQEFTNAGIKIEEIWYNKSGSISRLNKVMRIVFRIPFILMVFVRKKKVFRFLDLAGLQVFVGYVAYRKFFAKNERLVPIINSDISPKLHMQWSAAISINRDVFWWQDDYHHYAGFSNENYMPYSCTYAAALNQKGFETTIQRNSKAKVFARPQATVKPIQSISYNPRLGVATNAKFQGREEQISHIDEIKKQLGASEVYIRLHPNSKLSKRELDQEWMRIAPADETIEQYCNKVDLVLVGNSAVQLKLLCEGVPVIHTKGLDDLGYDRYGYCAQRFCYGVKDGAQLPSIEEINRFYQNAELQERLNDYVNVRDELPGLSALKNVL